MSATANVNYQFTITAPDFERDLLKALLITALKETDLVFSPARRKIETSVELFSVTCGCVIAGGTECGDHAARLLSGFLIKQVGEGGFVVERVFGRTRKKRQIVDRKLGSGRRPLALRDPY